jgi:hypothetical protein
MVDPVAWFAIATAAFGLWTLATGRPLRGLPRWQVSGRTLRLFGAYEAGIGLLVLVLVLTHKDGIAFLTYGVTAVTLATAVHVARRSKTRA